MSNRSGSPYSTPRDANRVPLLVAASTSDGKTPITLEADPSTHALVVSGGGGSNSQYAEGVTTSPATGTVALGRYLTADPTLISNQLYGLRLDSAQRLMVNPAALTSANDSVSAAQSGAWTVAATQSGTWKTGVLGTSSSTLTSVNGSNSSVQLLASNSSRSGAYFYNDSTAIMYLALTSSAATTSAYTVQVASQGYYELPSEGSIYTGIITAIWASTTGSVKITETS